MSLLTSYAFQDTFFHRLDPRTKVTWLVVTLALSFATNQIALLAGLIAVVLGLSSAARLDLRALVPMTKLVGSTALGVVLVQTVLQDEGAILLSLGPVNLYAKGLWLGVEAMLRLYCIVLLFLQFLTWTHPTDLSLALVKVGLPYKYAMLLGLALRFFPVLEQDLRSVFEAQEARGLDLRGPLRRALALTPVVLPFCLRTLRRANEVALAMELRGYGFRSRRTFLRTIAYRRADYALTVAMLLCLLGYFAARTFYHAVW